MSIILRGGNLLAFGGNLIRPGRTDSIVVSVPTGLSVSSISATTAHVDWSGNAPSYEIRFRTTSPQGAYTTLTTTGTEIDLSGLSALTDYEVDVRAIYPTTESGYTTAVAFSTIAEVVGDPIPEPFLLLNLENESIGEIGSGIGKIDDLGANALSPATDGINAYKSGSAFIIEPYSSPVIRAVRRVMEAGEIGAGPSVPRDRWKAQFKIDTSSERYWQKYYFVKFESGYWTNSRAGKVPGGWTSTGNSEVNTFYPPEDQPDNFGSNIMFDRSKELDGGPRPFNQFPWPTRAVMYPFVYAHDANIPRKGGKFAYNAIAYDPRSGDAFTVGEEDWIAIKEDLLINTAGNADGYMRVYVASMAETGGEWIQLDVGLENVELLGTENSPELEVETSNNDIFQGGGSSKPINENGGYAPIADVALQWIMAGVYKGVSTAGAPTWSAFDGSGRPRLFGKE